MLNTLYIQITFGKNLYHIETTRAYFRHQLRSIPPRNALFDFLSLFPTTKTLGLHAVYGGGSSWNCPTFAKRPSLNEFLFNDCARI